nr:hybrid signal transduction histidine kinase M [Tanacetum cinerariifolium]
MRRIGKGFSGVDTPLFAGMLVQPQVQAIEDAAEDANDDNETCVTLTKQVANLEQDKITQAIKITKLKQRVWRGCIQTGGGGIAELDADEDVTLEDVDVEVTMDAVVMGEPAEVEEVIGVVIASKLMTEVVTTATTTITAAQVPKASAPKRKRGVVIQDPEETATASVIVHHKDKAFTRELEAELNANINWDAVTEQVKTREKQDNTVMGYQALKRKPAELCLMKLGDLSIDAYFHKIESTATVLSSLGSPISNDDVVNIAIDGLPDMYQRVSDIIIHREIFSDLKMVRSMLTTAEMRLKSRAQATCVDCTSSYLMVLLANFDTNVRHFTPSVLT